MILKLFIPENLIVKHKNCILYGEVAIEEKSVSYFVISGDNKDSKQFRKLGEIHIIDKLNTQNDIIPIVLTINNKNIYIYLTNLGIKEIDNASVNIFMYTDRKILSLNFSWSDEQNDMSFLKRLLQEKEENSKKLNENKRIFGGFKIFLKTIYSTITKLQSISLLSRVLANTAIHDHMKDWKNAMKDLDKNEHGQVWTLLFDVCAGMGIILLFLFCIRPDEYILETSHFVAIRLRILLESLKGSPVGLKLNKQLNNFLLDCFTYHVNLWAIFLLTMSPMIRYLFLPLAILGFMGLSFQLAMLSDLIVLISIHAHCFYIYAAILYNIEKVGLSALWKVFLGKRKNVLKNRIESYDYMNRQLYISTMFFTILLFLLPTILVYYVVFASLRVLIYLMCYILMKIRRRILEFRVDLFIKWIFGYYYDVSGIDMEYMDSIRGKNIRTRDTLSVIRLNVTKSSYKYVFLKSDRTKESNTYMTLKQFLSGILKGEMINFSQVKSHNH